MTTHVHAATDLSVADKARLGVRAQLLAGASVSYNAIEAVIAIAAGVVAGSVALVGFGLDSVVEVSSGLIILWQFRHRIPESRERQALRLMAFSFFALAAYVTFESVRTLAIGHDPGSSPVGIGLAVASLIIMPFLSWAQRRTGKALGSNVVVADSTQTLLCTYLSAVLLVGLVLNATLGWSWADPIAGLVIAAVAVKEGREAWRGEGCCGQRVKPRPRRRRVRLHGRVRRRLLRPRHRGCRYGPADDPDRGPRQAAAMSVVTALVLLAVHQVGAFGGPHLAATAAHRRHRVSRHLWSTRHPRSGGPGPLRLVRLFAD